MIHSLLTTENPINSTESIRQWIEQRNREVQVDVKLIPFGEMDGWYVDKEGSLRHNSGRFFSIQGIHVETDRSLTSPCAVVANEFLVHATGECYTHHSCEE